MYELNATAWEEWVEWRRKEKRIKVGPVAEKKQQKLLTQYPPDIQQEIIDHSIMNSYQGLFPPKRTNVPRGTTRERSLAEDLNDTSWAE